MAEMKNITCTVCPIGCRMNIEFDIDGNIASVTGNKCRRGDKYARAEILNPVRTLTSTVRIHGSENDKLLPVRTDIPIPKSKMLDAIKLIKNIDINAPIAVGDIIIKDFIDDGINLIACKTIK